VISHVCSPFLPDEEADSVVNSPTFLEKVLHLLCQTAQTLDATTSTVPTQLNQHHAMSITEVNVGQLRIRYLVDGSKGESLGMFELTVPPGSNVPPPHSHTDNEEVVFVLEGTLRYMVGAESRDLTPGQTMRTPKGSVHGFSNPFGSVARALITLAPDIGPKYFEDVASVVNAGGPPDRAALVAVMSRYGLVPAAPH
jgi:quercetin dioxygenase-like cupin family protein